MAGSVEKTLANLNITLPTPASPIANYVPFVRSGNMLVISGQLCFGSDGKLTAKGQLGGSVSIEDGQKAARACAVNLLAQLKAALGDLDKVTRVVRLGGFINSAPGFTDGPKVMNGASDLMVEVFGEKGRHARSTVGVSALPADAAVEVDGLFEIPAPDPEKQALIFKKACPSRNKPQCLHSNGSPRVRLPIAASMTRRVAPSRTRRRPFLPQLLAVTAWKPICKSVPTVKPWCTTTMRSDG
jgi:enamine deaminase RidA (YjgF/YER057c/UK114 family)